jgi:hypothetical protein
MRNSPKSYFVIHLLKVGGVVGGGFVLRLTMFLYKLQICPLFELIQLDFEIHTQSLRLARDDGMPRRLLRHLGVTK